MIFKWLALSIAVICIAKAVYALVAPQTFYAFRQRQYASAQRPVSVLVVPAVVILMALIAWYGMLVQPVAWGWVVTAVLSLFGVLAVINLLRWSRHRQVLTAALATEWDTRRKRVDGGILLFGAVFAALALFVY